MSVERLFVDDVVALKERVHKKRLTTCPEGEQSDVEVKTGVVYKEVYEELNYHIVSADRATVKTPVKFHYTLRTDKGNKVAMFGNNVLGVNCTYAVNDFAKNQEYLFMNDLAMIGAKAYLTEKLFNEGVNLHKLIPNTIFYPMGGIITPREVVVYTHVIMNSTMLNEPEVMNYLKEGMHIKPISEIDKMSLTGFDIAELDSIILTKE